MSNNAYLIACASRATSRAMVLEHNIDHDDVGCAAYRIPLPWFFCFTAADLQCTQGTYAVNDLEQHYNMYVPCVETATALQQLTAARPLFRQFCQNDEIGDHFWQKAIDDLACVQLPYLLLDADEVLMMQDIADYERFGQSFGRTVANFTDLAYFADFDPAVVPYPLGNLYGNVADNDKARLNNTVALDMALGLPANGLLVLGNTPTAEPSRVESKLLTKFLRDKKSYPRRSADYGDMIPGWKNDIDLYITTGLLGTIRPSPDAAEWEFINFGGIMMNLLVLNQTHYIQQGSLDVATLQRALPYFYVQLACEYHLAHHFPARHGREYEGMLLVTDVFNLGIAATLGAMTHADHMFAALRRCYQYGCVIPSKAQLADFMMQLYADYRAEPMPLRVQPFVYQHWLAQWASPDLAQVERLICDMLDEHVRLATAPFSKCYGEFSGDFYEYVPWAVLLLLRLRQQRGLANPVVTHPAFDNVTSLLCQEPMPLLYDDFLQQTVQRMQSQGFDAERCYALQREPTV